MTHFWFGVLGVGVALIGVALVIFNRQFVKAVPRPSGPVGRLWAFKPGLSGRVPMVTVIGCGWIFIGLLFLWVAVTGQPLPTYGRG